MCRLQTEVIRVGGALPAKRTRPHWIEWLVLGAALASLAVALLNMAFHESAFVTLRHGIVVWPSAPSAAYAAVSLAALLAAAANVWLRPWRRPGIMLATVAAVAVVGLSASLVHRDDYFGGSCGEHDWPSGHLHAGYPYSWLDGHTCVPPGTPLGEYARSHPGEAAWRLDFLALLVDLLFWSCVGSVVGTGLGLAGASHRR